MRWGGVNRVEMGHISVGIRKTGLKEFLAHAFDANQLMGGEIELAKGDGETSRWQIFFPFLIIYPIMIDLRFFFLYRFLTRFISHQNIIRPLYFR
jgi:hypothetical protein